MTSLAWPERWPDLSDLGSMESDRVESCAALLKVNAEMFVAAPARDREVIETFETLALGFLPMVSKDTILDVARILAPCEDAPASILDALARHSPEARKIVIEGTARLPSGYQSDLLATPQGRVQLASRPGLDPRTVERLLVLHECETDSALAANSSLALTRTALSELVRRAREKPVLAEILLTRQDLTLADEAALYLAASPGRRASIRDGLAASSKGQRIKLSFDLSEQDVSDLHAAAQDGDVRQVERLLSALLELPPSTDWRILQIGRHALLALAFRSLALPERDALRIFLALHPALSQPLSAVKALVRIMRETTAPVALALVEAILGMRALSGRSARHSQ